MNNVDDLASSVVCYTSATPLRSIRIGEREMLEIREVQQYRREILTTLWIRVGRELNRQII